MLKTGTKKRAGSVKVAEPQKRRVKPKPRRIQTAESWLRQIKAVRRGS
ncbi:MAG: hypothetical protein MRY21_08220 [Simkaniaceae bacterium]|nr:hypothetical protein [Simkaniaceae bacterium]